MNSRRQHSQGLSQQDINRAKFIITIVKLFFVLFLVVLPVGLLVLISSRFYWGDHIVAQSTGFIPEKICTQNSFAEIVYKNENTFYNTSESGFSYFVKTPINYSHKSAWPLLLVFAPSISGFWMERYTGLTAAVTKAGFIIAYVDAVPMNLKTVKALEEIPESISKHFCIDKNNIFVSGHSDGATISQALIFLPEIENSFNGFISSAAGISKQDLQDYACTSPRNIFVLENSEDKHFKSLSQGNVQWWSECFQCKGKTETIEGCFEFENCQNKVVVKYCEQSGGHISWPRRQEEMVNFLKKSLIQ